MKKISVYNEFDKNYIIVKCNNKFGYVDENYSTKIPIIYDHVCFISEDICFCELNNKRGYINRNGKVVLPIIYDDIVSIYENDFYLYYGHIHMINNTPLRIDYFYFEGKEIYKFQSKSLLIKHNEDQKK